MEGKCRPDGAAAAAHGSNLKTIAGMSNADCVCSLREMAGAAMQPAVHTHQWWKRGTGFLARLPSSPMEDIDMLSSADILIAHCIIAVDAMAATRLLK